MKRDQKTMAVNIWTALNRKGWSIRELRKEMQGRGSRISYETLRRWRSDGISHVHRDVQKDLEMVAVLLDFPSVDALWVAPAPPKRIVAEWMVSADVFEIARQLEFFKQEDAAKWDRCRRLFLRLVEITRWLDVLGDDKDAVEEFMAEWRKNRNPSH